MRIHAFGDVAGNPVEIMGGKAGAGDDVIFILCCAHAGQIAFDPAVIVQHLGVDNRPDRFVHAVGGDPAQRGLCVGAFEDEFGE